MWQVDNNTPLAIERGFLRDRQGGEVWIVVIKGTFDVGPSGNLHKAAEQPPPARVAAWAGEPGKSSLLHDSDFVLAKGGTDVLAQGHAYSAGGRPLPTVEVGMRIGSFAKRIRVHGIRAWTMSHFSSAIVPGPARPFVKAAINYENAFGGTDLGGQKGAPTCCAQNPVGNGFCHQPKMLIDKAAPQAENLDVPIRAGAYDLRPAGFGPIAPHWMPRAALAGTYDEAWQANQAPLLPKDFDERFYRSAPADQQFRYHLPAGQVIELFNMTPEGNWRVQLPDLRFRMRVFFADSKDECADAVLHTVLLDPDQRRVQLVWHTSLPCHGREHRLRRAAIDWEGDRACLSPSTSMA
jgi:hypothetical protein